MEVKLRSETGTYKNKEGEERTYVNFFLEGGTVRVPIEVKYFGTTDKPDPNYAGRKLVLQGWAEPLPPKEPKAAAHS